MQTDIFGMRKLFKTTIREWYSQFQIGPERTRVFGAAGVYDSGLVFGATGTYTIYGQRTNSNNGILNVSESFPCVVSGYQQQTDPTCLTGIKTI